MEVKMPKAQVPRLSTIIGSLALVCLTGFNFIETWIRHGRSTIGYGIIFILAVSVAAISPFITAEKK